MNLRRNIAFSKATWAALIGLALAFVQPLRGQPSSIVLAPAPAPGQDAMAQQNAWRTVQSRVSWFQNSTRSAYGFQTGGYGYMLQQFQMLRSAYSAFGASLTQQQLERGANDLAELDAGLDIMQDAFSNYQQELAQGAAATSALNDLRQVLYQASRVWLQQLNNVSNRLRVGRG